MKIVKSITDSIAAAPSLALIVLAVIALCLWSSLVSLRSEVDDLTLRDLSISIVDEHGVGLEQISIGVESGYSFDEITPQYQVTMLGEGRVRLVVMFSWDFKILEGAEGYQTTVYDYTKVDHSELKLTLRPIE